MEQQTQYPLDNKVHMKISTSRPLEHTIYLRIPAWGDGNPQVSVNGQRFAGPVQVGSFAVIRRTWKDGDRIQLELPMSPRLEAVDEQHSNIVALSRGPLVLLAISNSRPVFEKSELSRVQESNQGNGDFVWMAARSTCDPS